MPKLTTLKPRVKTMDTRVGYRDLPSGLTPDQAYDRMRNRNSATRPLYGTARWQRVREEQLQAEPLCRMCMDLDGRAVSATVCDHVTPHGGDVQAFWAGPFQSLCAHHHNSLKQREDIAARIG